MAGAGDTSGDREAESGASTVIGSGIVEAFNGANSVIYYGKGGEIARLNIPTDGPADSP